MDVQATFYELKDELLDIGEERRVWYVGASRTKTNLFVIGAEFETKFLPNQEITNCESVFDVSEQLDTGKMELDDLHLIYHENWLKMRNEKRNNDFSFIKQLPQGNPEYELLDDFF